MRTLLALALSLATAGAGCTDGPACANLGCARSQATISLQVIGADTHAVLADATVTTSDQYTTVACAVPDSGSGDGGAQACEAWAVRFYAALPTVNVAAPGYQPTTANLTAAPSMGCCGPFFIDDSQVVTLTRP